jgi:hypothetical protein
MVVCDQPLRTAVYTLACLLPAHKLSLPAHPCLLCGTTCLSRCLQRAGLPNPVSLGSREHPLAASAAMEDWAELGVAPS